MRNFIALSLCCIALYTVLLDCPYFPSMISYKYLFVNYRILKCSSTSCLNIEHFKQKVDAGHRRPVQTKPSTSCLKSYTLNRKSMPRIDILFKI